MAVVVCWKLMLMKVPWLLVVLALALCGGCATSYRVRLNDGNSYVVRGRPRLNTADNRYYMKDAAGNEFAIPAGRVVEIAPVSMASRDTSSFLATPGK